jgi:hypothetical protein
MCEGFGLVVSKDMKAYFMEPNTSGNCSHSDLLERLGWKDNDNQFLRNFVRVEFPDWTPESFRFDEEKTLPGWVENSRDEIRANCIRILDACTPAQAQYEKACAPAQAQYEKACDEAWAQFEKVCDEARAQFEKVRGEARAQFEKVRGEARAQYEKVRGEAWAQYEKVHAPAQAQLIATFSKIEGYVEEK